MLGGKHNRKEKIADKKLLDGWLETRQSRWSRKDFRKKSDNGLAMAATSKIILKRITKLFFRVECYLKFHTHANS